MTHFTNCRIQFTNILLRIFTGTHEKNSSVAFLICKWAGHRLFSPSPFPGEAAGPPCHGCRKERDLAHRATCLAEFHGPFLPWVKFIARYARPQILHFFPSQPGVLRSEIIFFLFYLFYPNCQTDCVRHPPPALQLCLMFPGMLVEMSVFTLVWYPPLFSCLIHVCELLEGFRQSQLRLAACSLVSGCVLFLSFSLAPFCILYQTDCGSRRLTCHSHSLEIRIFQGLNSSLNTGSLPVRVHCHPLDVFSNIFIVSLTYGLFSRGLFNFQLTRVLHIFNLLTSRLSLLQIK